MDVYVPLQKYERYWKYKQDWEWGKYWVLRDLGDTSAW